MDSHLLSIFPTVGRDSFARVSITATDETLLPPTEPFLVDRSGLADLLKHTSLKREGLEQLAELDQGRAVQIAITDTDAIGIVHGALRMDQCRFLAS